MAHAGHPETFNGILKFGDCVQRENVNKLRKKNIGSHCTVVAEKEVNVPQKRLL